MGQRDRVVDIDQRVDLGEGIARQDALDEALDGGAVAGLLDAEALVGGAPGRDAGDLRQFGAGPADAARFLT